MALCRARACAPFWRLGPGPGPAGLRCFRRPLSSRSILAALISGAKRINGKYERFLERTFPRFYVLYSTFTRGMGETFLLFQEEQRQLEMFPVSFLGREGYSRFSDENRGIQALFVEVKEIQKIRSQMSRQRLSTHQLPYREMERLRQFRRDVIKAIPIGIIAIPPFANFLVIVLMYFFPRQLLIRYFWTPSQQVEFLETYDTIRRGSYLYVVESLAVAARSLPEPQLRSRLQDLCAEVCQHCSRCSEVPSLARPSFTPSEVCFRDHRWLSTSSTWLMCFEPGPVPDHPLAGVFPEASPAEPRPGDPTPGSRPAAPGPGAALRGGAASGVLPPWPELHKAGDVGMQSVAGAVVGAFLQAASFRRFPPGEQHGPALPQLRQG
ncbi:LETM1 domain-containing protein 1 isoform X3 [Cuculus canorus]|uniref:LETM1 domain-containing protein 1 isoform X3 n=1 Tax=Cuculus canorus TaxID=55661 RepID=UPI0023AA2862|nr:LETM1 domain-containing protein 1 isoform X3 [Cuculus canorus]